MNSIESGISGLDEISSSVGSKDGVIQENSATLVYGPPKVGKSILCNQFTYHGLNLDEPCLYLTTDQSMHELQQNMMDFEWFLQNPIEKELLYVIDTLSPLSGEEINTTTTYKVSKINDPTDLMVKVGIGTRFVFKKSNKFRSVLDSLTTPFAFNPEALVIRFLKAYIRRLKEAGATVLVVYTEGVVDEKTEKILKSLMDNVIMMDGEYLTFRSTTGLVGTAEYNITNKGIFLEKGKTL
ncbi:MAG TPA: RAD55 family ATPase [Methanobacteriaceae archaeon]|nr:RAD55 family ATPase [Methanobacteriaceae archaeon]